MTFSRWVLTASSLAVLAACSKSGSGGSSSTAPPATCANATIGASPSLVTTSATNVIPVYVADSATTGTVGYTNEPLVSVTICTPNHTSSSQCQTVSNILLDTGSFGLRVFGSALASNVALTQQTTTISGNTYNLAQCAVFGTGADWGPVKSADVILGNQVATNIPVHVIDSTFASMPTSCANLSPDTDPCSTGFNGILGVGPFSFDCGSDCASTSTSVNPGIYFACSSSSCGNVYSGACAGGRCAVPVSTSQQIVNPIAKFASGYNNGLMLNLPSVAVSGANQISGTMTIGIGSTASNVPASSVVVYPADSSGMTDQHGIDFQTTFPSGGGGVTYGGSGNSATAFIDSGSNGLYFPNNTGLALCSNSSFYCPASATNLTATVAGYSGTPTVNVNFTIATPTGSFSAYSSLGGKQSSMFDWGLPFFFGQKVFVGIDGTSATFNAGSATGPYWAF